MYRHVPTGTFAILAQRLGMIYATVTTWYRLVRDREWRRPRQRVHPAKPKVGIRASRPNAIWHVDTTISGGPDQLLIPSGAPHARPIVD